MRSRRSDSPDIVLDRTPIPAFCRKGEVLSIWVPAKKRARAWLLADSRATVRGSHGVGWRLRIVRARLATPGITSLLVALGVFLLFLLLVLAVDHVSHSNTAESLRLESTLATMWQVQAAVSGIALPLLALAIQLAGDQQQAATRSHEVLTRESWIFPIAVIALLGTGLTGVALVWRVSDTSVFLGMSWFVITLTGAVFAYARALITLFDPLRLRQRANEIIRERMSASLDESAARRLANNRLIAALDEWNVSYSPLPPSRSTWRIYGLGPNQVITDINVVRLKTFLGGLPRTAPNVGSAASPVPEPSVDLGSGVGQDTIQWLKLVGQGSGALDKGILAVRKDAFETFDPGIVPGLVKGVIRTERAT